MNKMEYEKLRGIVFKERPVTIGVVPGPDRTLLYGYDIERFTWHVFQMNGVLYRLIYRLDEKLTGNLIGERLQVKSLVPNKRLHPEACDFDFCRKLRLLDVHLPFTTYGNIVPTGSTFFGRVI